MGKFLKKIILFGIILIGIFQSQKIIDLWSGPFWGNKVMYEKMLYLQEDTTEYDLIFIGSSRTHVHVIPQIIDSVLNTRSFSLAAGAVQNPETWFFIDHFLRNNSSSKMPKYLVIELQSILPISDKNQHTSRAKYFLDYERFQTAFAHFLEKSDHTNAWKYIRNFTENQMKMGVLPDQIWLTLKSQRRQSKVKEKLETGAGYYPFVMTPANIERRVNFMKDTSSLSVRKNYILKEYQKSISVSSQESRIIQELINQCKANAVVPIFIKSVRSVGGWGLYNQLKNADKIDMSNPIEYPEFYTFENTLDAGHLNPQGAKLYSLELAKKLAKIIE